MRGGCPTIYARPPPPSQEEDQVLIDTKRPSPASTLLLSSPPRPPSPTHYMSKPRHRHDKDAECFLQKL